MGTDSIKLFDKTLADHILETGGDPLTALGDEEILLDYWGCHSYVFQGNPPDSISSLDYVSDEDGEMFVLLRPEHVDLIVRSLLAHAGDLRVMNMEQVAKVAKWRDYCRSNPRYLVAYVFDL
jgi:hypothetical protein